jgi:hypothetical protein
MMLSRVDRSCQSALIRTSEMASLLGRRVTVMQCYIESPHTILMVK